MKKVSAQLALLLSCIFVSPTMGGIVFIKSQNNPEWNQNGNQYQMDNIFGAGGWADERIEFVNASILFSSANDFIFLEMGNRGWTEGTSFIAANKSLMQNWVANGGRLLINGAWNEDFTPGDDLGFGVFSATTSGSDVSTATDPLHPIFQGPAPIVSTNWDGSSFRHQALQGNLTALMRDASGRTVLGETSFGSGNVVFGSLTLPFFSHNGVGHSAWNSDSINLHENIIRYAAATEFSAVPEPTSLCYGGILVTGMLFRRRRRA